MHTAVRRQTLADLLHRSAMRFPDKAAIICGDTAWSYTEFDAVCENPSGKLLKRELRREHAGVFA